jgi:hypothetical protein
MLQHDITNNKFYHDGLEITREEYDVLWKEWHDNLPPTPPPDPDPEIEDAEVYDILFGGAE